MSEGRFQESFGFLWLAALFFISAGAVTVSEAGFPAATPSESQPIVDSGSLADRVFSWACVYQKVAVSAIRKNAADMIVVEPDFYSYRDVQSIRESGKMVIAYLSVGEGEDYRAYASKPGFKDLVIRENPHWPGNYRVSYWDERWRKILTDYGLEILGKGFDGILFDVVDAWESFPEDPGKEAKMAHLLSELVRTFRASRSGLAMLLQNSHELFDFPEIRSGFDGMTQEGLFETWMDQDPAESWRKAKISALRRLRRTGKFIGVLDYTRRQARMQLIRNKVALEGFIPYFSTRKLDRLFDVP